MPSSRVLGALARALETSIDFLMSMEVQELKGVDFRKKARTSAKERSQVEAAVIERVEPYLAVEEILERMDANPPAIPDDELFPL